MNQQTSHRQWPIRLTLLLIGAALIASGLAEFHQGRLWFMGHEAGYGARIIMPTLDLAAIGALLALIGIVPWPKAKEPPRRDKWKTHL